MGVFVRFSEAEYGQIALFIQDFLKHEVYSTVRGVTSHLNSKIKSGELRLKVRDRLIKNLRASTIKSVCEKESLIEVKKVGGIWLVASVIVSQLKSGHQVTYSANRMREIVEFLEKQLKLLPRT